MANRLLWLLLTNRNLPVGSISVNSAGMPAGESPKDCKSPELLISMAKRSTELLAGFARYPKRPSLLNAMALATAVEVGKRMGKEVVVIKESPGFITSRINAMIGNEAFYMLQEGIASPADIDKALKLGLNHPMGPFELVDLVGLDTRLSILEYLQKSLGEKYRPAPLLVQYVKAGRLGRKSGRGVFEYPEAQESKS